MTATFELKRTRNGQYSFTLKAENGDVILNSDMYLAKKSAEAGIVMVQRHCPNESSYQQSQAPDGSYFFKLKTPTQHIIGNSLMYPNEASRDEGIRLVMRSGITTAIRDMAPG